MKKTIPFTKQIHFKTMISEITDIEVTHNLEVKENNVIEGDILVDGTYKIHEASQIEEEFHHNLPFTIEVDDKYNIQDAQICISDFYFEIINEEDLKLNVELEIRNVLENEKKEASVEEMIRNNEEKIPVEMEEKIESLEVPSVDEMETEIEAINNNFSNNLAVAPNQLLYEELLLEKEEANSINNEVSNINSYSNIFDTISSDETYVTYYVYIVRESDTVESILDKYKVTREDLSLYNDLENIKVGSKVIVPCHNE